MFSLKLKYQNEVRRVPIPEQILSFQEMLKTARAIFTSMIGNEDVSFLWIDDENDVIRCSSDEEIREAVRVMASGKATTLKFEVQVGREAKVIAPSSGEVHEGVQCDGCDVFPLIGVRFKCGVRDDFDLCEACEAKDDPKFPMLKISTAKQAPFKLIVVLKDENGQLSKHFQGTGDHSSRRCWGNELGPQHGPGPHRRPFVRHDHHYFGHAQHPPNRSRGSGGDWRPQAESILKGLGEEFNAFGVGPFVHGHGTFPQGEDLPSAKSASDSATAGASDGAGGGGGAGAGTTALPPLLAMADALISTLKGNQPSNPASTSCGQGESCGQAPVALPPFLAMADTLLSTLKKQSSGGCGGSEKCGDANETGGATTDLDNAKASGTRSESTWMPRHGRGGRRGSGGGGPCAPHNVTPPKEAKAEEARLLQLAVKESTSRSEREIEEDRLIEEALRESMADQTTGPPTSAAASSATAIIAVQQQVEDEALHPASRAMEPAQPIASSPASSDPTAVWARVWAKELQVLADMGFVDTVALLPLLQEHVGVPVSLCPQLNGVPPAEGMQRLLGALFAQSGMLH